MSVFIANFGLENHLWNECFAESVLATIEDADLRTFQVNDDKEGFITYCLRNKRTARGITPTRPVASRWFNLPRVISQTTGDLWLHREKEMLWWAISEDSQADVSERVVSDRGRREERVFVYRKKTTG
jgi:hypothetical protein